MKVRIHYAEVDSIDLEADTVEELREIAAVEVNKRGWNEDKCYSEIIEEEKQNGK